MSYTVIDNIVCPPEYYGAKILPDHLNCKNDAAKLCVDKGRLNLAVFSYNMLAKNILPLMEQIYEKLSGRV